MSFSPNNQKVKQVEIEECKHDKPLQSERMFQSIIQAEDFEEKNKSNEIDLDFGDRLHKYENMFKNLGNKNSP